MGASSVADRFSGGRSSAGPLFAALGGKQNGTAPRAFALPGRANYRYSQVLVVLAWNSRNFPWGKITAMPGTMKI